MSALDQSRTRRTRRVTYDLRPVAAGAKGYRGGLCMAITSGTSKGFYTEASSAITGVVVGVWAEDFDNTAGADGDVTANVEFSRERAIEVLANDTGTPVTAANREQQCYVLDDQSVTGAVGTVAAGVVYDVDANGNVHVEIDAEPAAAELAPGISAVAPVDPSSTAASAGAAALSAAQDHKHHIALATPTTEGLMSAAYASAVHAPVTSTTSSGRDALAAIPAVERAHGMIVMDLVDRSLWRFHSTSVAADTTNSMVVTPAAGTGRWLRMDGYLTLALPIDHTMADGTLLFTGPTGCSIRIDTAWYEVGTSWTGGTASAIGISTDVAGYNTKGDLIGAAGGDVAANLVATSSRMSGTLTGTKLETPATNRLLLKAGESIRYDQIVDAFTAGAATLKVAVHMKNPGV